MNAHSATAALPSLNLMNPSPAKPGLFYEQVMTQIDTRPLQAPTTVHASLSPEWVLAEKYEELTGVTCEAIRMRRKRGVWLDGKHTKVVLRRIYVNIKAADKWISEQVSQRHRA